jgi:glycine cleavage system H protein
MIVPEGLLYTKDHEWARIEGTRATVGITDYAQHSLGDITFVELPKAGTAVAQSKFIATVESVKAASDVYAPVSGVVAQVNEALRGAPELINQSPFEKGWFAVIDLADPKEKENLMTAQAYKKYLEGLSK